jgi:hypothetical protein
MGLIGGRNLAFAKNAIDDERSTLWLDWAPLIANVLCALGSDYFVSLLNRCIDAILLGVSSHDP